MNSKEKQAYDVYSLRVGDFFIPFEHLSDAKQAAWRDVVELLAPEPAELDEQGTCEDCGTELACPVCDIEKFAVVATTTGQPTAVLTQKV